VYDNINRMQLLKHDLLLYLDKFSALMTSSERSSDVDLSGDQIQRLLGRTRDVKQSRDSKSRIDVDIQLSDVIVVNVVGDELFRLNYYYYYFVPPLAKISGVKNNS